MLIKIHKNRSVSSSGTWGTKNENNYEILNFEFPKELEEYNKRIVYYLDNQKVWDPIIDNKAILTNAITTKGSVKAYIWCTKTDSQYETDVDFRTQIFVMNFFENDNADGIVPTEEQIDGFNTMLTAMNEKIEEIDELETTIKNAEAQRQENEETRQNNEKSRQTNEQTRQTQEADRERRTDEAIGNIEDKTAEYNANAEAKTTAFNNNATQKTNEFNSNYTQKVNDFNTNASSKESAFNSNASSKTSAFNSNAETKTNTFNTNATNKTNAFNSNATEKTTTFDNNASTKTSEFNTNAESKTSAFNDNATQKTTNFDNNASEKTDEFNTNAQEKIDEYDEHIVDYQAQIDELQEEVEELSENMPWNTTEQATEIQVTDAAKYSKNKLELFGNTEQASYRGKNLLNYSELSWSYRRPGVPTDRAWVTTNYIEVQENTSYIFSHELGTRFGAISYYDENKAFVKDKNIDFITTAFTTESGVKYVSVAVWKSGGITSNDDKWMQLEQGSTATDYEPYVGGVPSPNPDYPQPIHVVTGNNVIEVQGKNLFDQNVERKNAFSTGDIGQVVGYGNSSASYSYVNCAKVEANKTYTLSWKIDGAKGATSNRNSKIVDSNNIVLEEFATWINNTTHITFTPQNTGYLVLTTDISSVDIQLEQGSTATSYVPYYHADYPINLGNIELCKIGDYQDYFYKENGNWYKYGAIDKYVYNDDLGPNALTENIIGFLTPALNLEGDLPMSNLGVISLCNMLKTTRVGNNNPRQNTGLSGTTSSGRIRIYMSTIYATTYAEGRQLCADNNLTIYFGAKVPVITQITDETLISQLDAIYEHLQLVKGTNNIAVTAEDLAPYMELSYMQDLKSKLDNLDSRLSLLE
jgi:hypothetical protein